MYCKHIRLLLLRVYTLSPAPPLTVDNIMKAVEGVKDWTELAKWLGVYTIWPTDNSYGLKEAVEQFLKGQGNFQPSWRTIIFALDGVNESGVANHIRSYGEPVQGRCTHVIYAHTSIQKYIHTCHAMPQHKLYRPFQRSRL